MGIKSTATELVVARSRVVLSTLGLWVIVYYHSHYAAPLMATVFVLLVQCMRVLWGFRFLGRAVGVVLMRLIVLFSLLTGADLFRAQSLIPQPYPFFEWLHRHPILSLSVALAVLVVLRVSSGRVAEHSVEAGAGSRPRWNS